MTRLIITSFLLIIFFAGLSAQEYMSPQLKDFLLYTKQNYWGKLTTNEYESLHPLEWAWLLGAIFNTEYETIPLEFDPKLEDRKRQYLQSLWQELQDYVTEAAMRYTKMGIEDAQLRKSLVEGFLLRDPQNQYGAMVNKLGILNAHIQEPLVYSSEFPAGGRLLAEYDQPWRQSGSAANGKERTSRQLNMESSDRNRSMFPRSGSNAAASNTDFDFMMNRGDWFGKPEGSDNTVLLDFSGNGSFSTHIWIKGQHYDSRRGTYRILDGIIEFKTENGKIDKIPYTILSRTSFSLDFPGNQGRIVFTPLK